MRKALKFATITLAIVVGWALLSLTTAVWLGWEQLAQVMAR